MIAALRFGEARDEGGRAVRSPGFALRSTLPLSAACLAANGVCEQIKRLTSLAFEATVAAPIVPDAAARKALFEDAATYRVRGRSCDAFLLLRSRDARRLVAAAFGEARRAESVPLSDIEKTTLERLFAALAEHCAPLCGAAESWGPESARRAQAECASYFEARLTGATRVSLGFALTSDPAEQVGQSFTLEDLFDVPLGARVVCDAGDMSFASFRALSAESETPLRIGSLGDATLRFGDAVFARGTCGVQDGRRAFLAAAE